MTKQTKKRLIIATTSVLAAAALIFGIYRIWFYSPSNPVVILCAGDSITAASYPGELQQLLDNTGYKNTRVINMGISGHCTAEYLHFMKKHDIWKKPLPDWVLLQLGTNDVRTDGGHNTSTDQFLRNMNSIILMMKNQALVHGKDLKIAVAKIPAVCVSRNFNENSCRRVTEEINPAIERLAEEHGLFLVDNYTVFEENPEELPEIHPTPKGYRLIALNWFNLLHNRIRKEE